MTMATVFRMLTMPFPNDASETADTDGDGVGNNEDTDDDGDGVLMLRCLPD